MPLNQHHKSVIDIATNSVLAEFHSVHKEVAIAALWALHEVQPLEKGARNYSPLPDALQAPTLKQIESAVKHLHRMMENHQPEKRIRPDGEDHGPECNYGIFNLSPTADNPITPKEVHTYLRDKFVLKIQTLSLLGSDFFSKTLALLKENDTNLYYRALVEWVREEAEGMPEAMKQILLKKQENSQEIILKEVINSH
jgi:hypothetical protein